MSSVPNLFIASQGNQGNQPPTRAKSGWNYRKGKSWTNVLIHVILSILTLLFALPLLLVIAGSVSTEQDITHFGYSFIPHHLSFDAYQYLFNNADLIVSAYVVSIIVTVVGSLLSLTI